MRETRLSYNQEVLFYNVFFLGGFLKGIFVVIILQLIFYGLKKYMYLLETCNITCFNVA